MRIELSDQEVQFLIKAVVNSFAEDAGDFDANDIADRGMAGEVIGKLVSANSALGYKAWSDARKSHLLRTPINKTLFMGAGNISVVNANKMHKRLAFAISELGGLEQNGGMGTQFDEQMDKEGVQNIKDVIQDMMIAFGLEDPR